LSTHIEAGARHPSARENGGAGEHGPWDWGSLSREQTPLCLTKLKKLKTAKDVPAVISFQGSGFARGLDNSKIDFFFVMIDFT